MGKPRGPTESRFKLIWYWCTSCNEWHRRASKKGQSHKEFQRPEDKEFIENHKKALEKAGL